MKTDETMVERGSGNVFADLGFPDSDTHLLKSELVTCSRTWDSPTLTPTC